MKTKIFLSALLVLTITLAACAPKATAVPPRTSAPVIHTPTAKPTVAPTKTSAPTKTTTTAKPTVTPAPNIPVTGGGTSTAAPANAVVVTAQKIVNNTVTITSVTAAKSGWIVIHADQNGQPGAVIGHVAVPAGKSTNVKVTIDSSKATTKLYAMLHIDAGKIGTFEFPGVDEPVKEGSMVVMTPFNILK